MTSVVNARAHLVERAAELLARQTPGPGQAGSLPPLGRVAEGCLQEPSEATAQHPFLQPIALSTLRAAGLLPPHLAQGQERANEEIAMVQHQVLRQAKEAAPGATRQGHIVLITSALPQEGKSFLALNLANAIASRGARAVLLVDADGKADGMTTLLGMSHRPGLRELIAAPSGRGTDFVVPTEVERLSFLPNGVVLPGDAPAPRGTVGAALQRLAVALPDHIIILDSPPCLASSEATALAAVAAQVLVVVAAEQTARHEVEAALDAVDACPVLRLVLNRARLGPHASLGGYGVGPASAQSEHAHV